jgi:soluble lytic murein transglycosylase
VRIWRSLLPLCFFLLLGGAAAAHERGPSLLLSTEEQLRFQDALAAFRTGDWKEATEGFRSVGARSGLLADYARFFLAESLSRVGDLSGARQVAESVVSRQSGSHLVSHALLLAAALAARHEDEPAVLAILRRFLSDFGHRPEAPRVRYVLGLTLESQGRGKEAAGVFRELWLTAPASAYGSAAGDHLEQLGQTGIKLPPPGATERLDRAERLLATGMAADARDEAEALLAEGQDAATTLRALRVVAEAWRRLGQYGRAVRALDRALARVPAERSPGLLLEMARLQVRSGSWESALGTVGRLLRERPAAHEAPQGLVLRGRVFEETGRLAEARAAYEQLAREFPDDEAAGPALWRLGWLAFFQGDLGTAAQRFGLLAELPVAQGYRLPAAYWAGRSREGRGEIEEARRFYVIAVKEAPRSYYGLLADRRIRGVKIDPERPDVPPLPPDPLTPLAGDLRIARAEALRAVGLTDFALAELEAVLASSLDDLPKLYGVSAVYVKNEQYHLALRILRRHFADLARSGSPALPRAFWEMLYPWGWAREIREASGRAGLDPNLVAAVVREESSFFPLARSPAGARGLMQLMPETARPMAAVRGMEFGRGELLDRPEANLQMGTVLLAGLIKEFGEVRLAAAAYNAGPARVRKWWATRRSDDVDAFVEQIPFDETRHFVKRVLVAWEEYRRIYGADRRVGGGRW